MTAAVRPPLTRGCGSRRRHRSCPGCRAGPSAGDAGRHTARLPLQSRRLPVATGRPGTARGSGVREAFLSLDGGEDLTHPALAEEVDGPAVSDVRVEPTEPLQGRIALVDREEP